MRFHIFKFSTFSPKDSNGKHQVYSRKWNCIIGTTFFDSVELNCCNVLEIWRLTIAHAVRTCFLGIRALFIILSSPFDKFCNMLNNLQYPTIFRFLLAKMSMRPWHPTRPDKPPYPWGGLAGFVKLCFFSCSVSTYACASPLCISMLSSINNKCSLKVSALCM